MGNKDDSNNLTCYQEYHYGPFHSYDADTEISEIEYIDDRIGNPSRTTLREKEEIKEGMDTASGIMRFMQSEDWATLTEEEKNQMLMGGVATLSSVVERFGNIIMACMNNMDVMVDYIANLEDYTRKTYNHLYKKVDKIKNAGTAILITGGNRQNVQEDKGIPGKKEKKEDVQTVHDKDKEQTDT